MTSALEAALAAAQAEGGAPNLLRALAFIGVTGPIEIQALGVRDRLGSQYDCTKAAHALTAEDALRLVAEAERWTAQGIYLLPAPLRPGVETRHSAPGAWFTLPKRGGTSDSDVAARQVLAVDLDVERPTNTSTTDEETALSAAVAERAMEYLAPIVGADSLAYLTSGNGRQVWLALAGLPTTPEIKALLAAILAGLAGLLDTERVHVDLTLVDAKRILPACGSTKKKGAPGISERPHRRTAIVTPEHAKRLTEADLRELLARIRQDTTDEGRAAIDKALGVRAALKPTSATNSNGAARAQATIGSAAADIKASFDHAKELDLTEVAVWLGLLDGDRPRCPGCGEADSGVAILDHGFKCSHNRCQGRGLNGFRTAVDLTMEVKGLDKFEAVNALAERFGFDPLPPKRTNGVNGFHHGPVVVPPPESSGYLPECPPDLLDERGRGPDNLKAETEATREPKPWPEPELFGSVTLPPFPVEVLSPWLRDWAVATAESRQVPVDMPALLALASCSLAVSRGIDVQVTDAWKETTNLWVVYAAAPGERKSPVFHSATAPISLFQEQEMKRLAPELASYESDKRVIEGKIRNAELAASKDKQFGGCNPRDYVHEQQARLEELQQPQVPALIADDTTPEAMAILLSTNGERLGIFSSEGGPFEMMAGKYSDKNDLSVWLKCHSGDTVAVHRVKRPSITLRRPLLTIAITCQPEVVRGLASKQGFRGQGLLARFLYAMPVSTMGSRRPDGAKVPDVIRRTYNEALVALLTGCAAPRTLAMSPGAAGARRAMDIELEPRLGEDGDLYPIADWASKLVGLVARLAAVLHVADHAYDVQGLPVEIPLATWLRAQAAGTYALAHAQHAFSTMGGDPVEGQALRLWQWVGRHQRESFTAADVCRALRVSAEAVPPVLSKLERRGLARRGPPPAPTGGRPASPLYEVNPASKGL